MTYDMDAALADMATPKEGWLGSFTTMQALGAWRNGTRIVKIESENGDANRVGMLGKVLGSIHEKEKGLAYFVEWDSTPKVAVLVVAWKITAVN
ncbi:MAG TPA: hypothetical protein VGN16_09565 [Acidobacteriaceae bacterium]|jgi:hypothetical protein